MREPNLSLHRTRVHTSVALLYRLGVLRVTEQLNRIAAARITHPELMERAERNAS